MKNRILFIALSVALTFSAFAQNSNTLYVMENVFQNQFNNPAFKPISNLTINLFSGSTEIGFSGFPVGQFIDMNGSNGSQQLDPNDVLDKIGKNNELVFKNDLTLLGIGFKVKSVALQISLRTRTNLSLNLPEDLIRLVVEGNGKTFLDRPANLSNTSFNLNSYAEFGIGGSFNVGNKLRLGGRVKFLSGIANVTTEKSELTLTTDSENYGIMVAGSYSFRSANVDQDLGAIQQELVESVLNGGFQNKGAAIDLGFTYDLNDKIKLTGALLDLGAIKWTNRAQVYENSDFTFTYEGEDVFNYVNTDGEESSTDKLLDSLTNAIKGVQKSESYSSAIPSRLMASLEYKLNNKAFFGGVFNTEYVPGLKKIRPTITGYYRMQFGKAFGIGLSNAFAYRTVINPGIAITAKLGFFQLFVSTDNIIGLISLNNAKSASAAFGANLVFGGNRGIKDVTAP